ncbi:MAG: DNA methyltransferase [Solirubrobacteraceae bacterium]
MSNDDAYVTDDAEGQGWRLMLGDSCERLGELADASVDLSVCSPPFASLYTYSPSQRDLGNSFDRDEFLEHYGYIVAEQLRVTKPGRLACIHVQQLSTTKATHGIIGLTDFRGQVIAAFQAKGWIYHSEVTIDKDPQAQAIRTKAQALMFQTLHRDSASTRPALADYLIVVTGPSHLPLIERCVRLWSMPGELVLSPFAGIGSEGYVAVKHGRRFVGIELKASYWKTAVENLRAVEAQASMDFGAVA